MSSTCHYVALLFGIVLIGNINGIPLNEKIVGGRETSIFEHPYIISLRYGSRHVCGGAILDSTTILTAAHCVYKGDENYFSVVAGSDYSNNGGILVRVKSINIHSNYSSATFDNDIAILKINPLPFKISIQPIPIANQHEILRVKTMCTVAGWGYIQESSNIIQEKIRYIVIPIIGNLKCKLLYATKGQITNRQICAGTMNASKDACQGDSGGPLVANGKLVGIVSWGYGCARPGYPGVYTRVSQFRSWIDVHANT